MDHVEQALAEAHAAPPMKWPANRTVGRCGDMGPAGDHQMVLHLQNDGDVVLSVTGPGTGSQVNTSTSTVEFCAGGSGGGRSMRTREALIALMVAMEADNAESPRAAWPPARHKPPNVSR